MGTKPDKDIGCWMVELEFGDNRLAHVAVIHIDCIVHAAYLMPITRTTQLVDQSVTMHNALNKYKLFHLNRFINYYAFTSL